jgi:hypothetical protein
MITLLLIGICVFLVVMMILLSAFADRDIPYWFKVMIAISLCIGYIMTAIVLWKHAGIVQ